MTKFFFGAALIFLLITRASVADITVGTAQAGGNGYPFCFTNQGDPGTRYQQVYAASNFPGITTIVGLTFFDTQIPNATFRAADYNLTLSTSNFPPDSLDVTNLSANPGTDAQFFASVHLEGLTGSSFTITGAPFIYNPSNGSLLLDITVANANPSAPINNGYLDAMFEAGGLMSRAHNFGAGTTGRGLVTRFVTVPEPSTLALLTLGALGLLARRLVRN